MCDDDDDDDETETKEEDDKGFPRISGKIKEVYSIGDSNKLSFCHLSTPTKITLFTSVHILVYRYVFNRRREHTCLRYAT